MLPQFPPITGCSLTSRDSAGVFVNLYLPSTLRWTEAGGAQLTLTQSGTYPVNGRITMRLAASRPAPFALRPPMPAGVKPEKVLISIKADRISPPVRNGFVGVQRQWRNNDRIQLEFRLPV